MKKASYHITIPVVGLCVGIILFSILSVMALYKPSNYVAADEAANREIQVRLRDWGYYDGPITGYIGEQTTAAIKYFQRAHGLPETGTMDAATSDAIGVYTTGTQNNSDLYLLAKCVHAEARGEPYEGMVAVAAVILNRVKHPEFPNTIYGVIYQPWAFTAVHDGQINLEPSNTAYQAAQDAIAGWDPSYGSIFYYNPNVATSQWIFNRQTVTVIGGHIFAI